MPPPPPPPQSPRWRPPGSGSGRQANRSGRRHSCCRQSDLQQASNPRERLIGSKGREQRRGQGHQPTNAKAKKSKSKSKPKTKNQKQTNKQKQCTPLVSRPRRTKACPVADRQDLDPTGVGHAVHAGCRQRTGRAVVVGVAIEALGVPGGVGWVGGEQVSRV